MLDTYTGDLLAAAEDALQAPAHLTPRQLDEWHARTLRARLPLIREALRLAREEGGSELATQIIDQAVFEHPAPPPGGQRTGRTRLNPAGARPTSTREKALAGATTPPEQADNHH